MDPRVYATAFGLLRPRMTNASRAKPLELLERGSALPAKSETPIPPVHAPLS
jgi:hypothetical protein